MELYECLAAIKKRLWMIAAVVAFAVISAWLASQFFIERTYESTATIIASRSGAAQDTKGSGQQDVLLNANYVKVYFNLAESDSVAENIIRQLGLKTTVGKIRQQVGVDADYETGILKITVKANNPDLARDIANGFIESLKVESGKLALQAAIQIIDAPKVPLSPTSPKVPLNVLLAAVGGIFAGLLLALLFGAMEQSTEEIAALQKLPNLRLLGCMPRLRDGKKKEPVVLFPNHGTQAEAVRMIRTNLLCLPDASNGKVILVTSPRGAEGKTTFAANLAVSLAQLHKQVLLVECNWLKPSIHQISNLRICRTCVIPWEQNSKSDYKGYKLTNLGIDTVPEFAFQQTSSDSIGSSRMSAFLQGMAQMYDFILLDGPPALSNADALILGRLVRQVIVVADYRNLSAPVLEKCTQLLTRLGAEITGVVVNNSPVSKAYR